MPSDVAVETNFDSLCSLWRQKEIKTEIDYETLRLTYSHSSGSEPIRLSLQIVDGLNCCGIANIIYFEDIDLSDDLPNHSLTTLRGRELFLSCALLETAKRAAWKDHKSLLYASIAIEETPNWQAAFDYNGWVEEYKLMNRNTENTIIVYSFNLLRWRPVIKPMKDLFVKAFPITKKVIKK